MPWDLIVTTLLLLAGGLFAGIINTIAGGGSLLTLPILIFAGLSPGEANGTNRIFMLVQSCASAVEMHRRAPFEVRATVSATVPALIGALIGAWLAVVTDAAHMRIFIGAALLVALVFSVAQHLLRAKAITEAPKHHPVLFAAAMFLMGVYGGFIQAGLGAILPLVMVALGRWALLPANGAKNVIIALYTVPVLVIFCFHNQVCMAPGLVLSLGALLGARIGAGLAVRIGPKPVLALLIVLTVVASQQLMLMG